MVFVIGQLAERFLKEFLFLYLCQPDDDTPRRDILYKIAHTRTKKYGLEISKRGPRRAIDNGEEEKARMLRSGGTLK
jgi:hypothetical protein